ncbi:MAG: TatD family nuclease-associated radical SAM protein, partial [Defluviitaleaceae bacterium]|nr:TatD family nuclease-associated radical SAM protein [Defluviitaleaceae bacterium]
MTIAYQYGDALYLNITNECPCDCVFCIRNEGDGINPGQSLRLNHEPSLDEIKAALAAVDFSKYREIVFCGYGEPTCRLTILLETAKYLKGTQSLPIRLNTNGLSDLINKGMIPNTASLLAGYIDHVSISLNAPDNQYYRDLCNPRFGDMAYDALLDFARDCKDYVPQVTFSVLESALEEGILEK